LLNIEIKRKKDMSEIYDRQKMQEEIQRSDMFSSIFSKVVSGKSNYISPTTKEIKPITSKCPGCGTVLDERQKFCHECGSKNEGYKAEKK
jgi:hypothetical protein